MNLPFTFGTEEEFLILGANQQPLALDLTDLQAQPDCPAGLWSVEAHVGMVEHGTPVCANLADLFACQLQARAFLQRYARRFDGDLYAAGTHPTLDWTHLTMQPVYQPTLDELQDILRALLLFGMHTHVHTGDEWLTARVFNALRPYLAYFIALSANSPFFRGRDTGLCSYRNVQLLSLPRSGTPPPVHSVAQEQHWIRTLLQHGLLEKPNSVWTDARLHPVYGTIEVRIMDMQSTAEEGAAIACAVGAVSLWLAEQILQQQPIATYDDWALRENRWQAVRYGLQGRFLGPDGSGTVQQLWQDLLHQITPVLLAQGAVQVPAILQRLIDQGNGASQQRATGSPNQQVQSALV